MLRYRTITVHTVDALKNQRCRPCRGETAPLGEAAARELLARVPQWSMEKGAAAIARTFTFKNYLRTMAFANAVAYIAQQEDHHPQMTLTYRTCEVRWTTHAVGGLSENDFICAAKVDALLG